jgi:MHS family proline/betaine transporter-like MFS transporter
MPAYYMMAACVIGAIALVKVPEPTRWPLNGTETPGTEGALPPVALEPAKA